MKTLFATIEHYRTVINNLRTIIKEQDEYIKYLESKTSE